MTPTAMIVDGGRMVTQDFTIGQITQEESVALLRREGGVLVRSLDGECFIDRTRLMLRLAHDAGLRRREIAMLHSDDMFEDLDGWSLRVHGKGDKERDVPLTLRLGFDLRALGHGYAFPGQIDGHLSPRRVGELAVDVLPSPWTIHTLRHSFATRAYGVDSDLFVVQELLGHASPATTRIYVQVRSERLRSTVAAIA